LRPRRVGFVPGAADRTEVERNFSGRPGIISPEASELSDDRASAGAAVVIPAYNEEDTIGDVVRAAIGSGVAGEVVVVSDGSDDRTAERAREAGARVVELPVNHGKGAALQVGIDSTTAEVLIFLDGDLIGLKPLHVRALAGPVVEGRARVSLGVFEGGRAATDFAHLVAPFLSGQRAVRREVLRRVSSLEVTRFGVEVALTRYVKSAGERVERVVLRGVTHRMKEEKMGALRGFAARMKMYWEVARTSYERLTR